MKLTTFFIFLACLHVSAHSYGQKITLDEKAAPLEKIFREIKQQAGYTFWYEDKLLQNARTVDIHVEDASLKEVLDLCFAGQPLTYEIIDNTIVVKPAPTPDFQAGANSSLSSPFDIHGRVTDSLGNPLAGASVTVKGIKGSIATNENGEFVLKNVSTTAFIIITNVGYERQEIKWDGKSELIVVLKILANQLGGVEVTYSSGYQAIPKERATGSFTQIDNATLNEQVGPNILNRLDGVANGILFDTKPLNGPNREYNFSVRGLSTINGPMDPLIVLDNFPYEGDINNINPNDIESITILKDAAAASIWGTKAGNGVIVITTKKGRFNQPLKVELNSNVTIIQKPDLFYLPQISSGDYIDVEKFLFSQGFYDANISDSYNWPALSPVVEILAQQRNGTISAADADAQINALKKVDIRNEYDKYFYQNAVNQQYAVNLRGGSGNVAWILSGGYDRDINDLDAGFKKVNIHFENSYKPVKDLLVTMGILYTNSNNTSGKPAYNSITVNNVQVPYLSFADANGNPLPVAVNYRAGYTDTAGGGSLLNWKYYPLEDYKHNTTTTNQQDLLANVGLNYHIGKGLSLDIKYQYERQNSTMRNLEDQDSYYARNLINLFTQIDPSSGVLTYIVPVGGVLNLSQSTLESQDIRGQINYNRNWGKNNIVAIAGTEIRQAHSTGNANTIYGYNDDNLTYSNVDLVNAYPTYINGGYTTIPTQFGLSDILNRFVSYYSNIAYTYNEKYTITGSGRRDASNLFGVNTNNKWNPFWSVGGSWNISKEPFYRDGRLPYLRARATYGFSGNVDQTKSAVTTLQYGGTAQYTNLSVPVISQFNDPDLRWEKVGTLNIGLDFATKKNLISGSVEYYVKKGSDLFGLVPLDYTAGLQDYSTITKNVADMETKGLDLQVNTKNLDRSVKWYSTLLLNYNVSKTTKYYQFSDLANSYVSSGTLITPLVGHPLYSVSAFRSVGLDKQGNPQGIINGKTTENYDSIVNNSLLNDLVFKGSAQPVVFGAIQNSINWKEFSLIINIKYELGYYFVRPSINYSALVNSGIGNSDYAKRWQNPGDEAHTYVPSFIYPVDPNRDAFYTQSQVLIDKGDNIRLQFVNLSYDFGRAKWNRKYFQQLQIYVNANNLGILWRANKDHLDPDYPGSLPATKGIAFGVKASF